MVAISTVGIYLSLVVFSRIAGLRSFAQMTNFDMAATVAFGSIVATTAVDSDTSLLQGMVALAALFAAQAALALARCYRVAKKSFDAGPLLLMSGSQILTNNLSRAQMTRSDLRSKLRLAGITRYDQVTAVVLEATGEVSVLPYQPQSRPPDPELFATVRDHERLDLDRSEAPSFATSHTTASEQPAAD